MKDEKSLLALCFIFSFLVVIFGFFTILGSGATGQWNEQNKTMLIKNGNGSVLASIQQISFDYGVVTATEIFNFTSNIDYTFNDLIDFKFRWQRFKGNNNITSVDLYYLKNVSYLADVPDYGLIQRNQTIPNITFYKNATDAWNNNPWILSVGARDSKEKWNFSFISGNLTCDNCTVGLDYYQILQPNPLRVKVFWNETNLIGYHQETRYRGDFVPFHLNGVMIRAGQSYIVKAVLHKKAETGSIAIQTIPSFMGVEAPQMSWWNTSRNFSSHSLVSNYNNTIIFLNLNNASGNSNTTTVFGNGTFLSNFHSLNFTKNNLTEIPYYINNISGGVANVTVNVSTIINASDTVDAYWTNGTDDGTASNGTLTYYFFEPCNNLDQWTVTGSPVIDAGTCRINGGDTWNTNGMVTNRYFNDSNISGMIFKFDSKTSSGGIDIMRWYFGWSVWENSYLYGLGTFAEYTSAQGEFKEGTATYSGQTFTFGAWQTNTITIKPGSGYTMYVHDSLMFNNDTWKPNPAITKPNKLVIQGIVASHYFDNITAIQTTSPMPSWSGWSNLESRSILYIPPTPINLNQTNNSLSYVNHTWQAGLGNVTDSYNVSLNGVWTNGSLNNYSNQTGMNPGDWSNISVYAWNNSGIGSLNLTNVGQNIQLPALPSYALNGTANNSLGAPLNWVKLTWNGVSVYSNATGFYEFSNATSGTYTLLAQQIGYDDYSETFDLTANSTKNITLSEKETVSEATTIDYSLVGAMFGGLLAFVLLRRKKKDDDYKYKRE